MQGQGRKLPSGCQQHVHSYSMQATDCGHILVYNSGTYLTSGMEDDSAPLAWLEERIAAATLLPSSHGEAFNVLHYENNQHYDSHMDTFDPKVWPVTGKQVVVERVSAGPPGRRGASPATMHACMHADGKFFQLLVARSQPVCQPMLHLVAIFPFHPAAEGPDTGSTVC
jgi:hypothetical protein